MEKDHTALEAEPLTATRDLIQQHKPIVRPSCASTVCCFSDGTI